jgi:hypothetical protein
MGKLRPAPSNLNFIRSTQIIATTGDGTLRVQLVDTCTVIE